MTTVTLNPDGPRDPDHAREVAGALSEAVRVLNHITRSANTLPEPSDVYSVLGNVRAAAYALPQLLGQIRKALDRHDLTGQLRADNGGPGRPLEAALEALIRAESSVTNLAAALDTAHAETSHLYLEDA